MDGHISFPSFDPSEDQFEPVFKDTHFVAIPRGSGRSAPPESNNLPLDQVLQSVTKKVNAWVRLPPQSSKGKEEAKKVQETLTEAIGVFAEAAGKDMGIKIQRNRKIAVADNARMGVQYK